MSTTPDFKAMDEELKGWGIPLAGRPLEAFKRLHGPVKDATVRERLFEPLITWYIDNYGEAGRWDGVLGRFPILIRDVVYEAIALFAFEDRPGIYKEHIRHLPKEVSDTFDDDDFRLIAERLSQARASFAMMYNLNIEDHSLSKECRDLFHMGMRDIESASTLLIHAHNVQGSVVASHEAAEKFFKIALLRSPSKKRPRSFLHNIPALFEELASVEPRYRWLVKPTAHLQKLSPSMEMRYAVMQRAESDAVSASTAAIHVCGVLANIWLFDHDRGSTSSRFVADRFYQSWVGKSFYCKWVKGLAACLTYFNDHPVYGRQMADLHLNVLESSLYLEVRDPAEEQRLRHTLLTILRSPMRRVTPQQVGLKMENGDEGTYSTMMLKVPRPKGFGPA